MASNNFGRSPNQPEWREAESYINVKLMNTYGESAFSSEEQCKNSINLRTKCLIKRYSNKYLLRNRSIAQRYSMVLHETNQFPSDGILHLVVIDLVCSRHIGIANRSFFDDEGFDTIVSRKGRKTLFRARFLKARMEFDLINLPDTLEKNIRDWQFDHFGRLSLMKCPETIITCMDWIGLSSRDFALKYYRKNDFCPVYHSKGIINTFLYPNVEFQRYKQMKPLPIEDYSEKSSVFKNKNVASEVHQMIRIRMGYERADSRKQLSANIRRNQKN